MSEKLVDINERIDNMRQLDSVVLAMRGIAAARTQQSRALVAAIESYSAVVSRAIGEAAALLPEIADAPSRSEAGQPVVVLVCAEHGFAGAFSDLVFDKAAGDMAGAFVMLAGTRGTAVAPEHEVSPDWTTPMASQTSAVTSVADRIAEALYVRIAERGGTGKVTVFYPRLDADRRVVAEKMSLLPLDFEIFRQAPRANPPLITLDPEALLERLTSEYVYSELCAAAMHAFAAENAARMEAMAAAGGNIEEKLDELGRTANQVRQDEVTAEIIELAAGARYARSRSGR